MAVERSVLTFFQDDFEDGVIDSAKWRSNGRTGGSVTEHAGVLDVRVVDGNDIQYLSVPDLPANVDLTLEVPVQVRSVALDKNAGFWFGDDTGTVGFQCDFSETHQRFTTPVGALGEQFGTPAVSVGGGSGATWHVVKIVKMGQTYTISIDDRLVGSSSDIQPANLHFS